MLYLQQTNTRLALKLFRGEPAISGFDWNFSPIHTSSPPLFNGCGSGPPLPLTAASAWTWIDHPVSGLRILTLRPIKTCSRSGSGTSFLNLASTRNSPDRSTKSTRSYLNVVPQLVNTGFQVLFHSPPGVLFTFPSQYYALSVTKEYLALRGGPPLLPSRFHVSSMYSGSRLAPSRFVYGAFTLSGWLSQKPFPLQSEVNFAVRTPWCTHHGLGSAGFARRYSRYRCFFLFLRLLRCVSSPGSPPYVMDWRMDDRGLLCRVSPFRYLRIQWIFAPPRSFSQLITSFVGS